MEDALNQIKALAEGADDHARKALMVRLRDLMISLEDPDDTVERIALAPLEPFTAKTGVTLRIFHRLSASEAPLHVEALAEEAGADPVLLAGRLLRYWASVAMIAEFDTDTFTANTVTRVLASPKGESYVNLYYELIFPVMYELPAFLERTGHVNPTDQSHLPMQTAYGWEGDLFAYFKAFPAKAALFDMHMQVQRDLTTNWARLDALIQSKPARADEILFVDVGGGAGHQCQRFRERFPDLPGRMVLQDLPQVIQGARSIPGVENMGYNIFTPQPLKNAKFYYMRGVLHDFPDAKCKEILANLVAAMGPDSAILIDEMVLPDKNISWVATGMDLQMMANLGSQERTRSHWRKLLASVGLQVNEVILHGVDAYQGVTVATKAA
ncbi:O-methyl transferase B [Aspergillus ellipticus CBS 707.79]|uniref:O-methyl transferase B n=1 Tax=Aspergillus ellipticus CBS 707.79 TaxID=1448320 RepID=A0A319CWB4_9EURO|nr:O-methyl transferase B [Aspergillus ellipticus CBS 707.79]